MDELNDIQMLLATHEDEAAVYRMCFDELRKSTPRGVPPKMCYQADFSWLGF